LEREEKEIQICISNDNLGLMSIATTAQRTDCLRVTTDRAYDRPTA